MWADTEIRRDLIRGWRDEAVALWRELYREPPEQDPEEDPDDESWEYWWMAREATQVEIAICAMDIELAREIDDICWRNMAEVRILDRRGGVEEIAEILAAADSIKDPLLRGKAVNGICQGVKTPAVARDLGLLGCALSIPSGMEDQQNAVFHLVSMLGDATLWRWVDPPRHGYQWLMLARASGDTDASRFSLEIGLLERNWRLVRQTVETIAATDDLPLNEWAFRRLFSHMPEEVRGACLAVLSRGPLGNWAAEFALATFRSMMKYEDSFNDNVLSRTFGDWKLCGYARDNVLAELAVATRDPSLVEEMIDPYTPQLTLAQIGIENGDPRSVRSLEHHYHRASGLAELGRRQHDEALLFEACRQFDGEEKDRKYLYCLSTLIDVASNPPLRPPLETVEVSVGAEAPRQLALPMDF